MKRFVGLDVAQATTAICVVDADGRTLAEGVTATEPGAIAAFLRRRAPDAERIGLETGPLSVRLWNERRALGLPVIGMDARHANAGLKVMPAKTDRNDPGVPERTAARGGTPPASPSGSAPDGSAKCTSRRRAAMSCAPSWRRGACWSECVATWRTRSVAC